MRAALFLIFAGTLEAHDAPARVTVQLQARLQERKLTMLVRIPLEAVRDVDFPTQDNRYLDIEKLEPSLTGLAKIWVADNVVLYENGRTTAHPTVDAVQISAHADRSFASYEQAHARLHAPPPRNEENLVASQVFLDVALTYPIQNAAGNFALKPSFANLGEKVDTVLHYQGRTLLLTGDQPVFPLNPTWFETTWTFVKQGFIHILEGIDHLLFLLCLVIPNRQLRSLIKTVTAFTAAHSLTLIASALGYAPDALWFPPFVEVVIALSILYLALANIVQVEEHGTWLPAFFFGLIHGFGFSFALRESLQFAGAHLPAALLSFNIGVELGQLAALAVMVPVLNLLLKQRAVAIILSALIAHQAWHWLTERGAQLAKYQFTLTTAQALVALRWLLAGAVVAWAATRFRSSPQR